MLEKKVSVDVFSTRPYSRRIVLKQDLKLRLVAAKLVTSTSADKFILVFGEIYDYGDPGVQLFLMGHPLMVRK